MALKADARKARSGATGVYRLIADQRGAHQLASALEEGRRGPVSFRTSVCMRIDLAYPEAEGL